MNFLCFHLSCSLMIFLVNILLTHILLFHYDLYDTNCHSFLKYLLLLHLIKNLLLNILFLLRLLCLNDCLHLLLFQFHLMNFLKFCLKYFQLNCFLLILLVNTLLIHTLLFHYDLYDTSCHSFLKYLLFPHLIKNLLLNILFLLLISYLNDCLHLLLFQFHLM